MKPIHHEKVKIGVRYLALIEEIFREANSRNSSINKIKSYRNTTQKVPFLKPIILTFPL